MKVWKKILLLIAIIVVVVLLLLGGYYFFIKTENVDMNQLMDKLYADVPKEKRAMYYRINDDNFYDFLGNAEFECESAIASTPLVDDLIHSVVLIDVADNADISKIMQNIADNIDFDKYSGKIKANDIIIKSNDDLIIFIVIEDESVRNIISEEFDRF